MTVFKSFMQRLRLSTLVNQTQLGVDVGGDTRKWDVGAIDQAYEVLLDIIGLVLDGAQVLGLRPQFRRIMPLKFFYRLFEGMETELLIQWKLKKEKNLDAVFERQKKWLNAEKRAHNGFFPNWNRYCRGILETVKDPALIHHPDPWKSLVLNTLTDIEFMNDLLPVIATDKKNHLVKEICALFETLYNISPHHIAISFLNLIELGTGERAEIIDPGKLLNPSEEQKSASAVQNLLSRVINHNDWTNLPTRLLQFWEKADRDFQ